VKTRQLRRPVAEDLFTWDGAEPRLIGSKCAECGAVTFPAQQGCPRCTADAMERCVLGPRGTLWTWTTQEYPLKQLGDVPFEPFIVGYVELPGEVRVESRIVDVAPAELRIGMELEVGTTVLRVDPDGADVLIYCFAPAGEPR
jgi:uncharacterized OB-fold protein